MSRRHCDHRPLTGAVELITQICLPVKGRAGPGAGAELMEGCRGTPRPGTGD